MSVIEPGKTLKVKLNFVVNMIEALCNISGKSHYFITGKIEVQSNCIQKIEKSNETNYAQVTVENMRKHML